MNFSNPELVQQVVEDLKSADVTRSENRAKINRTFNGEPPYTEAEAEENGINTNVSTMDGTKIAADARQQWENAFTQPGNYFIVQLDAPGIPGHKKYEWSKEITRNINRPMKRSADYFELIQATGANVTVHGPGPVNWTTSDDWCPEEIGIEDLLIPSETRKSFKNLGHFAIYRKYTPYELFELTHGDKVDPGWNMEFVMDQLKVVEENYSKTNPSTDHDYSPEKIAERYKADGGFYASDSVPTINTWDFYHRAEHSKRGGWMRKIIMDAPEASHSGYDPKGKFLYNPGRIYAKELSQILHCQFVDGANVAPFKYHSVRSLGFLLYPLCHLQSRLFCKRNDATFEALMNLFRNVSAEDRERLEKIDLYNFGILPQGVEFVPGNERYIVPEALVEGTMNLNRQSMAEKSSSFVRDMNAGQSDKEMTAAETMARVNSAAQLMSGFLQHGYKQQEFQYREIGRRFCRPNSTNPDVIKFRKQCLEAGVPEEMLDVERWEISAEKVIGNGNKIMGLSQAQELLKARNLFDPEPQREILHIWTEEMVQDHALAEALVPIQKEQVTDASHDAQLAAGTLMMGIPVDIKTGVDHIPYVEAMLKIMAQVIQRIEQGAGPGGKAMATEEQIIGLQTMAQNIAQHIQVIAQDPNEKQRTKVYGDQLGKMMNLVKAYAERLQEQRQKQQEAQQIDPEARAKIATTIQSAQVNSKIKEQKAQQQVVHKEKSFAMDQSRKEEAHKLELHRKMQDARIDAAVTAIKTHADVAATKARASITSKERK